VFLDFFAGTVVVDILDMLRTDQETFRNDLVLMEQYSDHLIGPCDWIM